jgi:hypothetical protein
MSENVNKISGNERKVSNQLVTAKLTLLNLFCMEDDLNFFQMENDLSTDANGRRP